MKELDPHQAHWPDGTSSCVLYKKIIQTLVRPLMMLFKISLNEDNAPPGLKKANLVPIREKGDREVALNYKSVSLTCMTCNILEKTIRK